MISHDVSLGFCGGNWNMDEIICGFAVKLKLYFCYYYALIRFWITRRNGCNNGCCTTNGYNPLMLRYSQCGILTMFLGGDVRGYVVAL